VKPIHQTIIKACPGELTDARIVQAITETLDQYRSTVHRCVACGAMLLAKRESMASHRGGFVAWIDDNFPESRATLYRWMGAAERGLIAFSKVYQLTASLTSAGHVIEIEAQAVPLAKLLTLPDQELTPAEMEVRQLWFNFSSDKTLRELGGVSVDGDEPHRITRAANGKLDGGFKGEDRKDWPTFVGRKLSDITTHLEHWPKMTPAQKEQCQIAFGSALNKWPTPMVEWLGKAVKDKLKKR
jgi:hypothetical protein